MNHTSGSTKPSRNSQVMHNTTFQPTMSTTPVPETLVNTATALHSPVKAPLARSTPSQGNNSAAQDTSNTNTPMPIPIATQDRQHQVEVLIPCTRQYNRIVDPQGRPLQPGTVIICNDLPFIMSTNGRIYIYRGGNMKAYPREHRFLVNETGQVL